jgi:sorbitol/mannitol transport system substrate-binding protein
VYPSFVTRLYLALTLASPLAASAAELVVATVNNGHMITLQGLSHEFEKANPGVKLRWVTLEEEPLRQQVATDIATRAGKFDVLTIGSLEAPLWGKKGWLVPIQPDSAWQVDDLLPNVRAALTVDGKLMAAPFYGESSMTMVRTDLMAKAGVKLPTQPTWAQVKDAAARMHNPSQGVYGICLRGKAGWGANITLISTMVNTHGGQWFDMKWQPQLTTRPWKEAVSLYADLLRKYGPPGAVANNYNENLTLFSEGKCAIWVDATVAGGFVDNPKRAKVAGKVEFLHAPVALTPKGASWLWVWALAVPTSSRQPQQAQAFVRWATSKAYLQRVAATQGWGSVPGGTRSSTYATPAFRQQARYAVIEQEAIAKANPTDSTLLKSPYSGIQFPIMPEFQSIGTAVGQQLSGLLTDPGTVDEVLARSQALVVRRMKESDTPR